MLAIESNLISEYIAFQRKDISKYNNETISKLFKYIHPFKMSVTQKNSIGLSDEEAQALSAGDFVKIRNFNNENELIQNTTFKIMLSKANSNQTLSYPYINILNDETDISITATYKDSESRLKAREHIKALVNDAIEIKIYDRYLSKINRDNDSWNSVNLQLLLDILPLKRISIKIYCEYNWNNSRKMDLKNYYNNWNISKYDYPRNMHDRYIETDKVIILLSSGFIHLADSSSKDFTYSVKIKK